MADIRLISILPTQTVPGVQQPLQQGTSGQPSGTLSSVSPGTVLNGFIVNRDATGNPVLRTDSGDVTFASNFFLKIGSEVSIRVGASGGNTVAHILSVNGQPPEIAESQPSFAQDTEVLVGDGSATAATATPGSGTLSPIITVTGTLITSAPATDTNQQPLAAGSQLTLKIVALDTAPAATTSTATSTQTQSNPAFYATYAKASGIPVLPPAINLPINAPSSLASILPEEAAATPAPQTPSSPTTTPQANAPTTPTAVPESDAVFFPTITESSPVLQAGQTMSATVIANEPTGEALVQTPAGVVRLQPGVVLPPGSKVTFEVSQIDAPLTQTAGVSNTQGANAPMPLTQLARHWPAMQEIINVLSEQNDTAAANFINNMPSLLMPSAVATATAASQPGMIQQNIPAGLMVFIAALKGGDIRNWLGKTNADWLEDSGRGDLLKKAGSEFTAIGRQFTAPPAQSQSWQTLFFPVVVSGLVQQVRLFVKRDKKKDSGSQGKKDEDTRFVLEVEMSQLGEMQMDGFVRKQQQQTHFDLIIRSLTPMPAEMQNDIIGIYNSTGQLTGYRGTVVFQAVKEFPVNPMEEVVLHAMNTVVA